MSNKILSLIILLCVFGLLIGGYFYFFVFYGAVVNFQGNVSGYNIELSSESVKKKLSYTCEEQTCSYEKIPPLNYTITISKEGFENHVVVQKVQGKGIQLINFELFKKTEATNFEASNLSTVDIVEKKRVRLKYKNFFLYYDFGEKGVFYIREYLGKLFLYRDAPSGEILIYDFEKVSHDKIHISPVYGTDLFTIYVDEKNYLFDNKTAAFRGLDLAKKIEYGKKGLDGKTLIFVTEVGSYIYNLQALSSEYYYLFSDFVNINNNELLGIIKKVDENRKKNMGISGDTMTQVFRYNTKLKNHTKVYETRDEISEMYFHEGKLLLRIGGKLKELNNY